MDRLTAFVALHHAQLRLDHLKRNPDILMATPILQGLGMGLSRLEHSLETAAAPLADRIAKLEPRGLDAIAGAHKRMDAIDSRVKEVESFIEAIGSNGGDPLPESSEPSDEQQPNPSFTHPLTAEELRVSSRGPAPTFP
jgi:hypothetical protein